MDLTYLSNVRPSQRQYAWQQLEAYAFVHFGLNTMTRREWGRGDEDPAIFDPSGLDADQWARAVVDAGLRGIVLTCKHHDGFCLWPSSLTRRGVASSPWRGGAGDVVADVAAACARHGLKFGVYLSPWDRAEPSYGAGRGYDDFFVGQLVELLTGYGPVFAVWLDGACGEGPAGRRQLYDWERYYRVIRALQPGAVICVCGPDVRWCGNEAGATRADEWSVVPRALLDAERIAARSQQEDAWGFGRTIRSDDVDLGSRAALERAGAVGIGDLVWYPAEVDTSIRPSWFYRDDEDGAVRTPAELFEIYCRSAGGNAGLLLNIPPTPEGRFAPPDVAALSGLGRHLRDLRAAAIGDGVTASTSSGSTAAEALTSVADDIGYWMPAARDAEPWIELRLPEPAQVSGVILKEQITEGQRVERMRLESWDGRRWVELAQTRSVGYQRILGFTPVVTQNLRARVTASRGRPRLAAFVALRTGWERGGR
ncbi:MAG: alpha-L-fucosidase [Bifidobacteriaceae bacterium]|jgi:alpha-L-fucosidase|nr:alpha-L-fucosidase [Bifidobacteriaceae bacterium]